MPMRLSYLKYAAKQCSAHPNLISCIFQKALYPIYTRSNKAPSRGCLILYNTLLVAYSVLGTRGEALEVKPRTLKNKYFITHAAYPALIIYKTSTLS